MKLTSEAVTAIRWMRHYARLADRSRDKAFAARDATRDRVTKEILNGRRNVLDGNSQVVIEKLGLEDLDFKANVGDNRWYIDQATMWAAIAQVELKICEECDEQTIARLRNVGSPRAQ
jgi:hypothetical protein